MQMLMTSYQSQLSVFVHIIWHLLTLLILTPIIFYAADHVSFLRYWL